MCVAILPVVGVRVAHNFTILVEFNINSAVVTDLVSSNINESILDIITDVELSIVSF
jgi:hypothetical protein